MLNRVSMSPSQKRRIYDRDSGRCKAGRRPVGDRPNDFAYEIHHIDYDPSNTIDRNLEVRWIRCHNRVHPWRWRSKLNSLYLNWQRDQWIETRRQQKAERGGKQLHPQTRESSADWPCLLFTSRVNFPPSYIIQTKPKYFMIKYFCVWT